MFVRHQSHLHDNNGFTDQHLIPGQGTIEWPKVFDALDNIQRHRRAELRPQVTLVLRIDDTGNGFATTLDGLDGDVAREAVGNDDVGVAVHNISTLDVAAVVEEIHRF